ncbi:MAG: DUF6516 family protein [Beijerinckiaceae bacterium]
MKAELLIRERLIFGDGAILEIKVWRVPKPLSPSRHELKYSLFYGRRRERLVAYDNERGKGDHRHYHDREEIYIFTTIEQLLEDFKSDVATLRGEAL